MRRRKELILELTPLLDIILIMMFFVLMQNTQDTDKKKQEADSQVAAMGEQLSAMEESAKALEDSLEEQISDISESLSVVTSQLGSFENFKEYAQIVTLAVVNKEDGSRIIYIIEGENEDTVLYDWDSLVFARNSLENKLLLTLENREEGMPTFIDFHYQDDVIFRQDYQFITEVLDSVTKKSTDIYVRKSNE